MHDSFLIWTKWADCDSRPWNWVWFFAGSALKVAEFLVTVWVVNTQISALRNVDTNGTSCFCSYQTCPADLKWCPDKFRPWAAARNHVKCPNYGVYFPNISWIGCLILEELNLRMHGDQEPLYCVLSCERTYCTTARGSSHQSRDLRNRWAEKLLLLLYWLHLYSKQPQGERAQSQVQWNKFVKLFGFDRFLPASSPEDIEYDLSDPDWPERLSGRKSVLLWNA